MHLEQYYFPKVQWHCELPHDKTKRSLVMVYSAKERYKCGYEGISSKTESITNLQIYIPAGGMSIETAFYGNLSRLKARGVKQ